MRRAWIAAAAATTLAFAGVGWLRASAPAPAEPAVAGVPPEPEPERPQGFWVKAPRPPRPTPEQRDLIARLEAIGYLPGFEKASDRPYGVVRRRAAAYAGPRLYVSGHSPEAWLIDADGRELHHWRYPAERAWPDVPAERRTAVGFRRAYLYPNGDLLGIFEGIGLVKLDARSRLLWAARNGAHHALDVLPDGDVLVLARTAHVVPEYDAERPILEDFVVQIAPDGTERRRVSLLAALLASPYRKLLRETDPRLPPRSREVAESGDIFHTNSLQLIRRDHPASPWLRAGRVLVSIKHLNALAVVDLEAGTIPWLRQGDFLVQHEARLQSDDSILLFDNHTRERGSRALLLSADGEEIWQHPRRDDRRGFYSGCCGAAYHLANGDIFVVVTTAGRAIEVTPDHEIVWEFLSPHRAGRSGELVAALFDMVPLPEDFPLDWIPRADRAPEGASAERWRPPDPLPGA